MFSDPISLTPFRHFVDPTTCAEIGAALCNAHSGGEGKAPINEIQNEIAAGEEVVDEVATTVVKEAVNPVNYVVPEARLAEGANALRRATEVAAPQMTRWGWSGGKAWRDAVDLFKQGGTIENIGGKIPTKEEALNLLSAAGAKVERIEEGHLPPNPHVYPHINFTTPSGGKGAIQIDGL